MAINVYSAGRRPNSVMVVGEAPGREEAAAGAPFVGMSGQELKIYLQKADLDLSSFYRTNVVKTYIEGNPDPTPDLIEHWTPKLLEEVAEVRPELIITAGRFATRFFLGEDADLERTHGLPHRAGDFDLSRRDRGRGATIIPAYHPAMGLYDNDARVPIWWDFQQVGKVRKNMLKGRRIFTPSDKFIGYGDYTDVSGRQLEEILRSQTGSVIAIDTEGIPSNPWSIQISIAVKSGYVLRFCRKDFQRGVEAIRRQAEMGAVIVFHNAMYDLEMCRVMGLELNQYKVWDSMYAAYLTRIEPQGLKPLAYRWCGVKMTSYEETVGDAGHLKQIEYLLRVAEGDWEKPEPRLIFKNDGTSKVYTPQPVQKRAMAILSDGDADVEGRWGKVDADLRVMVEKDLGQMPVGTLEDIPLNEAVEYSAKDADVTLRLYQALPEYLRELQVDRLMADGMEVLPIFEDMQYGGMPASMSRFEALSAAMEEDMGRIQNSISYYFFDERPFNPASPLQVQELMNMRGLKGTKKTDSGAMSTGRKSIEHLRSVDDAIDQILTWREHQKVLTSFCAPILSRMRWNNIRRISTETVTDDIHNVRCQIKATRTATRRLAAADPNLLAIPVRNELGVRVRDCYVCPPGYVFGGWDLDQVEMRWMAHLSRDPLLIKLILDDLDIHSETAARIFGLKIIDNPGLWDRFLKTGDEKVKDDYLKERYQNVDKMKHRYPAKRAGFGIITNIQGPGLFDQLRMYGCEGWSAEKCDALILEWLKVFVGVAKFLRECKNEVKRTGVVRDAWDMPRYLPGVWAVKRSARAEAERTASSHKIQGGAQGLIQHSMAWLRPYIKSLQDAGEDVRWVLQIHDELIFMFKKELWEVMDPLVREALTEHHGQNLVVPLSASGNMSESWGGLK